MGVRRAVGLARAEAENARGRVYAIGPLIHNLQALGELERLGVETLDEACLPCDMRGSSAIIRAHGVSPQIEGELRGRGAAVVDATCPRVKASQLRARAFAEAGFPLFLAGEKNHAEIAGILGYAEAGALAAGETCLPRAVAGGAGEARALAEKLRGGGWEKAALIGQTTISEGEYRAIAAEIAAFFPGLEIAQTICTATRERQDSLRGLFGRADALVVAGGRESANARRLFAVAESSGKPCVLAETARDIPHEFFGFGAVGLAAGASTPDSVIEEIECALAAGACRD